jgi:Putative transposase
VLQYLSRYTHRTAIGNERILRLQGDEVVFSARAKRSEGQAGEQGKKRTLRLRGPDFIGRFMQHVLPSGLKRIRHYGLLANPNGTKLAQARAALHMPTPNPKVQECAQDFMARVARVNIQQCPVCQQGCLGVVQTLAGAKRLPDPFEGGARKANSRAPPAQGP